MTRPASFNSAITRRRKRRARRHDLARHDVEQNTASGRAAGLNRSPQPPHTRTPGRPEPSDTTTGYDPEHLEIRDMDQAL
ncbi:hypothetical protein, partial [Streptomyces xanthophaeus]